MWFKAISRLTVNIEKSELNSVERIDNLDELAVVLGCQIGCLPFTYLGPPLGGSFKSANVWGAMEERV